MVEDIVEKNSKQQLALGRALGEKSQVVTVRGYWKTEERPTNSLLKENKILTEQGDFVQLQGTQQQFKEHEGLIERYLNEIERVASIKVVDDQTLSNQLGLPATFINQNENILKQMRGIQFQSKDSRVRVTEIEEGGQRTYYLG